MSSGSGLPSSADSNRLFPPPGLLCPCSCECGRRKVLGWGLLSEAGLSLWDSWSTQSKLAAGDGGGRKSPVGLLSE